MPPDSCQLRKVLHRLLNVASASCSLRSYPSFCRLFVCENPNHRVFSVSPQLSRHHDITFHPGAMQFYFLQMKYWKEDWTRPTRLKEKHASSAFGSWVTFLDLGWNYIFPLGRSPWLLHPQEGRIRQVLGIAWNLERSAKLTLNTLNSSNIRFGLPSEDFFLAALLN